MPMTPNSAPKANNPNGLMFFFWPMSTAMTPQINQTTITAQVMFTSNPPLPQADTHHRCRVDRPR